MFSIWDSITTETQIKLSDAEISISFNKPKNDDSHVKAKTGVPNCYWVFAKTKLELWVELELKPQTKKGQKVPQHSLFSRIKGKKTEIEKKLDAAIELSTGGNDCRIKSYIRRERGIGQINKNECISRMVSFITVLTPVIFVNSGKI